MAEPARPRVWLRLAIALGVLGVVSAGVVYLTVLDRRAMEREVASELRLRNAAREARLALWFDEVSRESARQMAAPFLWNVESLDDVPEGSPLYRQLQRRMWQFVYGRDDEPAWHAQPCGPLESVLLVDRELKIVAASDPLVVGARFARPPDGELFAAALKKPQVRRIEGERGDGQAVFELTTAVPNARGALIGFVRLRYVGGAIAAPPSAPVADVALTPRMWGPLLAGLLAALGLAFGALATYEVAVVARRLRDVAKGRPLEPEERRGVVGRALSVIEARLESLQGTARRDDALLSALSEALREGVLLFDEQGRSAMTNRQARQMLGWEEAGAAPVPAFVERLLALNPELATIVRRGLERRSAVRDMTLALALPHGGAIDVQATAYVLAEGTQTVGLMLVLKDRASIAALERSLREASRLQAIAGLTGAVAHEVKNPLGAIGVHVETLRRKLARGPDVDPSALERLAVVREEVDRLRDVLEEWLRLTGPEERTPARAPVSEVLAGVARLLRVEARHRDVELVVDCAPGEAAAGLAAPRLKQVLLNLCLNALQAMPRGGRLTLRARVQGDAAEIEVEDTGAGIPPDVLPRIFEMHFTTRAEGSGLGLAICRRLVEEVGGVIDVSTRVGRGTTFRILLPLASSLLLETTVA